MDVVLKEVYSASNLTKEEGENVMSRYSAMLSLLPTVQDSVGNLTDNLAKEPFFAALKNFDSLGGLLSCKCFILLPYFSHLLIKTLTWTDFFFH